MAFSVFPDGFPDPQSKFQKFLFAITVGFFNGWLIAVLAGFLFILIHDHSSGVTWHGLLSTLTGITPIAAVMGGLFGMGAFTALYFLRLDRIGFWRMWRLAFPLTGALTGLGLVLFNILGGFLGSLVSLGFVVTWFEFHPD